MVQGKCDPCSPSPIGRNASNWNLRLKNRSSCPTRWCKNEILSYHIYYHKMLSSSIPSNSHLHCYCNKQPFSFGLSSFSQFTSHSCKKKIGVWLVLYLYSPLISFHKFSLVSYFLCPCRLRIKSITCDSSAICGAHINERYGKYQLTVQHKLCTSKSAKSNFNDLCTTGKKCQIIQYDKRHGAECF